MRHITRLKFDTTEAVRTESLGISNFLTGLLRHLGQPPNSPCVFSRSTNGWVGVCLLLFLWSASLNQPHYSSKSTTLPLICQTYFAWFYLINISRSIFPLPPRPLPPPPHPNPLHLGFYLCRLLLPARCALIQNHTVILTTPWGL